MLTDIPAWQICSTYNFICCSALYSDMKGATANHMLSFIQNDSFKFLLCVCVYEWVSKLVQ